MDARPVGGRHVGGEILGGEGNSREIGEKDVLRGLGSVVGLDLHGGLGAEPSLHASVEEVLGVPGQRGLEVGEGAGQLDLDLLVLVVLR